MSKNNIEKTDIAWAAGIIDGEGCIYISKTLKDYNERLNDQYSLNLSVKMVHRPTIERLKDIFETGSIIGQARKKGGRPCWIWKCATRQTERVLRLILPYLITKQIEARIGISFIDFRDSLSFQRNKGLPEWVVDEYEKLFISLQNEKKIEFIPRWNNAPHS